MYKFCTHCGAKMPNENAFCTNCGAKFSQIPTPQQNMAPTNINYNTSNSNTMPPYMHNQQTQQINNMQIPIICKWLHKNLPLVNNTWI